MKWSADTISSWVCYGLWQCVSASNMEVICSLDILQYPVLITRKYFVQMFSAVNTKLFSFILLLTDDGDVNWWTMERRIVEKWPFVSVDVWCSTQNQYEHFFFLRTHFPLETEIPFVKSISSCAILNTTSNYYYYHLLSQSKEIQQKKSCSTHKKK